MWPFVDHVDSLARTGWCCAFPTPEVWSLSWTMESEVGIRPEILLGTLPRMTWNIGTADRTMPLDTVGENHIWMWEVPRCCKSAKKVGYVWIQYCYSRYSRLSEFDTSLFLWFDTQGVKFVIQSVLVMSFGQAPGGKNYKALAAKSSRYLFKKIYMKNQIEGSSTGHLNPKIPTGFWTFLGKTDPSLAGMITLLIH